ncbi:MAG: hypothetical protein HY420_02235 [Candidatus Kerfeldbacteria bacterium]|nr:hypothetical protein [Candidatus Kerfeldbacteria bacterium]
MTKSLTISILFVTLLTSLLILPAVGFPVLALSLFSTVLLLTALLGNLQVALMAAVAGGFCFDLLSAFPFGTYTVSFIAGLAITRWLFRTRLTNRSLFALLTLVFIGLTAMQITAVFFSLAAKSLAPTALILIFDQPWLASFVRQILFGLFLTVLMFIALRLTGKNYSTLSQQEF